MPEGHEVCHKCDHPPCQNGAHLFTATHWENMADMKGKGRGNGAARNRNRSSLTDDDVREVRRRRAAGETLRAIGWDFGITEGNVSLIARKLTFAEVSDG